MSLDVCLKEVEAKILGRGSGIFVREAGQTRELSREEWDRLHPGAEPVVAAKEDSNQVYWANITHNLGAMADLAGLYEALWRPDEIGVRTASHLAPLLREGLKKLKAEPAKFIRMNPANGWGSYAGLVRFVEKYLEACEQYPDAEVTVSR